MNKDEILSVSEVNKYIKNIIDNDLFLGDITLKGEISNLKVHTRGHLYFSLKDSTSKLSAVMFYFNATSIGFTPKDGMSVEAKGKISVYEVGGSYQIIVSSMKEAGQGDLNQKFLELKDKLNKEGLFDTSHKKALPRLPKRIGVITAQTGAAVRDIISTINRRYPIAEIILFPSLVQGSGAKDNLIKMINIADTSSLDVIIIGRGGGSIEDLWPFNEEEVARAIYNASTPFVSAVGHEIDFTICDFVSDLRAPTPTGAAEMVVPSKDEILRYLNDYKTRIHTLEYNKIKNYNSVLDKYKENYIIKNPLSMYNVKEQILDKDIDKLNSILNNNLSKINQRFSNLKASHILSNPYKLFKDKIISLKTLEEKLELINPTNILKKGYSITTLNSHILKDIKDVKVNDNLNIMLYNGEINTTVKEVK
ncbi:MAG: exodeoxyribonuclease VII large subunit [Bacilli bacterium]